MAGQIPQRFIDDLLARIDIAEVVGERVTLKKAGKNLSGLCPFHDEKSPSFTVSQDKQFYHCFGCGAHGSALRFLMEYDRLNFPEAVEQLAARLGMEVEREHDRPQSPHDRERERKRDEGVNLLERAQQFFQSGLQQSQASVAREYLQKRGLSEEIMARFGIGFAYDSWDALKQHLSQHGVSEAVQVEYGLLVQREDTGRSYDRFRHRVMFPIRDWKGRTVGFGGRVLDDAKPKYLNSPETPVFHKGRELYGLYEARQHNDRLTRIVVVEGYMDVVALAQHDITNVVATLGTAATEDHLRRLYRMVNEVVFCFDGDDAGRRAAQRALEHALPVMIDGRQARFLFLPEGEDPDSLVRKEGAEAFERRVQCASALSEFIFDQARLGLDLKHVEGRERFVNAVLQQLQPLPEGLLRTLLVKELSDRSGVEVSQLNALMQAKAKPGRRQAPVSQQAEDSVPLAPPQRETPRALNSQSSEPGLKVLRLLLHTPGLQADLPDQLDWCPEGEYGALLADVIKLLKAGRYTSPQAVLAHYHGSERGAFLVKLLRQPPEIPKALRGEELQHWIAFLQRQKQAVSPQEEYQALLEKSRGSSLSKDEKQRLTVLINQLAAK